MGTTLESAGLFYEKMKNRDIFVDFLRGCTMLLVIWAHCGLPFSDIIGYFHMPMFFFLSGYYFKDRDACEYVKIKIKSLYIPFVIYELVFLVSRNLFAKLGLYTLAEWSWMTPISSVSVLLKELIHIALFDNVDELLATFWFLTALFCSTLVYFLINRFTKNRFTKSVICLFLVITAFIFTRHNINIKFSYNFGSLVSTTFVALWFINLGNLSASIDFLAQAKLNLLIRVPCYEFVALGILVLGQMFGLRGGMLGNSYNSIICFAGCSISGIYAWTLICYRLYLLADKYTPMVISQLSFIGKNSIHFMALQFLAMKPVSWLFIRFGNADGHVGDFGLAEGLSKTDRLIGFVVCTLICYLVTRIIILVMKEAKKRVVCNCKGSM